MTGWLVAPLTRWLAAAAAVAAGVWAIFAQGRAAERRRAEAEALRAALRRREVRDGVTNVVSREPDPAQRLRERWSRD